MGDGGRADQEADFATVLRWHRRRAGLTQDQLADLSGLSVRTVRNLELAQTRPYRDSVLRLAGTLRLAGDAKERLVLLGRRPLRPAGSRRPDQLPPDTEDFTGRAGEVAALQRMLTEAAPMAPPLCVVTGCGGAGKTALAVHVAHQVRDRFPDGALHATLRGTDGPARDPVEVLGSFLRALGVDGRAVPNGLDARVELYRALLAGRRTLVVLDDAAGEAQVRPLLPGGRACAVLVTSRAGLSGLAGARRVELGMLPPAEAIELLGQVSGPDRVVAEPAVAGEIVALCDHLPLAVRIAGARLAARPHWDLGRLAERLADKRHRLDELTHGDLEVRASIELSYQGLGELERRAFRRLGLLDAADIPAWAAAALLDVAPAVGDEVVERLRDARILEVCGFGPGRLPRFRLHDLLRLYARERASEEETSAERTGALRRAFDAWRRLLELAGRRLDGGAGVPDEDDGDPLARALVADPLAWFDAERPALLACVAQACAIGQEGLACDLAVLLAPCFRTRGYFDEWRRTHELVLAAVQRSGNRGAEGALLMSLGHLHTTQDRYEEALACFRRARSTYRQVGDLRGEAAVLHGTGFIFRLWSRYQEALACFQQALDITTELGDRRDRVHALLGLSSVHLDERRLADARFCNRTALAEAREIGYRSGEARALRSLAALERLRGRFDAAQSRLDEAMAVCRELGDLPTEAHVLLQVGELRREQGRVVEAKAVLERCVDLYREFGDRFNEALSLRGLGQLHQAGGRLAEAVEDLGEAERIFGELRLPLWEAETLRSLGEAHVRAGCEAAAAAAARRAAALLAEVQPAHPPEGP